MLARLFRRYVYHDDFICALNKVWAHPKLAPLLLSVHILCYVYAIER
jgi:hypothetical protein